MRYRRVAGYLSIAALCLLCLELAGLQTGLSTTMRGDIERETRFLAQYGQFSCVAMIVTAIWLLDPIKRRAIPFLIAVVLLATGAATMVKHLSGRVRPHHEHAGMFLGPNASLRSSQASFPSGHTTSAFALSGVLVGLYPRGRSLFWTLAGLCGALRWIADAHWISDVLAGAALGLITVELCNALIRWWTSRHSLAASSGWTDASSALSIESQPR